MNGKKAVEAQGFLRRIREGGFDGWKNGEPSEGQEFPLARCGVDAEGVFESGLPRSEIPRSCFRADVGQGRRGGA